MSSKKWRRLGVILTGCVLAAGLAFGMAACGNPDDNKTNNGKEEEKTVSVTGVSLSQTTLELQVGESFTLEATVAPSDASNKRVSWKSEDSSIASVTSGRVVAVSDGETTITATTADGGFTASCEVTVTSIPVGGVLFDVSEITLTVGDQQKLNVTVLPDNATNKTLTWTSSEESVATINELSGMITAMTEGTTKITATSADGSRSASCTVTVSAGTPIDYEKDYIAVSTVEDWLAINNDLSGKYYLTNDIDFEDALVPSIGFAPGQAEGGWFKGVIDGRGYALLNAHFVSGGTSDAGVENNSYSGMVSRVENGTIRNIGLINCSTEGEAYNGLITAWNKGGLIENCYVQGRVVNNNEWWDGWTLGGVLVNINQNNGTSLGIIRNCVSWSQRDGITYGLLGSNFTQNDAGVACVYNNYVIQDASISDWALCGEINGNGVTYQPIVDCAYVPVEEAKLASSYPMLNAYYWVIEDGHVPYLKNPDGTARDYNGPEINEAVIVPEITLDKTSGEYELSNGMAVLHATVKPSQVANATLIWTSSDENVATVDQTGLITFVGAGTVTITVTVEGYENSSATCVITIIDNA